MNNKTRTRMAKVAKETFDYYNEDPERRGFDYSQNNCMYFVKETKEMCAVGRCMYKNLLPLTRGLILGVQGMYTQMKSDKVQEFDDLFTKKYKGFPMEFWVDLQNWHDSTNHFTDCKCTIKGKDRMDYIINRVNTKCYG